MDERNRRSLKFGRHLRSIRRARKLSLGAVARKAGRFPDPVTKSHLSRIENGYAEPTFRRLRALCRVYDISIATLAERFELDLRNEEEGGSRASGAPAFLHDPAAALVQFEAMLETGRWNLPGLHPPLARFLALIGRIECLVRLGCYHTAHDRAAELLDDQEITTEQRRRVLHCMATAARRRGQDGYADMLARQAADTMASKIQRFDERAPVGESAAL